MKKILIMICCILIIFVSCVFIACDNKKTNNESLTQISESTSTDELIEYGGYIECIHNAVSSYHSIPYKLLEYVGYEEAIKWIDATSEKSSKENDINCIHKYCNIYDFIHYFDVPKDVFVDIYYNNLYYTHNYDIELLYNGSFEEVEKYYIDTEARKIEDHKRCGEELIKSYMVIIMNETILGKNKYEIGNEVVTGEKYNMGNVTSWSIPEFIYNTGMTKEQFELAMQYTIEKNQVPYLYKYNIDMIFNNMEYIQKNMDTKYPVMIDEMIRSD